MTLRCKRYCWSSFSTVLENAGAEKADMVIGVTEMMKRT